MRGRRYVARGGAVVGALAIAAFLGAVDQGAAEPVPGCSTGKPLCAMITSTPDSASRSPADADENVVPHYMTYSVEVSYNSASGATSTLTNLAVTLSWNDLGVATPDDTTSAFVASASDTDCTLTATRTITCTGVPKSLRSGESFAFDPLVFRTSTTTPDDPDDVEATGTNVSLTASAKETPKPPKGGTNVAFVTVPNATMYEDVADEDISIAGGTLSTTLATSNAGTINQTSKLAVPGSVPRGLFKVTETNYGGTVTCPAGLACFGQHVTTEAVGLAPVNLQIEYMGDIPGGLTENSLEVVHVRSGGAKVTISDECSGVLNSGLPSDWSEQQYPNGCRRVDITHLSNGEAIVRVDAWDFTNGGWDFG